MKRRTGALLMALMLALTSIAPYAEEEASTEVLSDVSYVEEATEEAPETAPEPEAVEEYIPEENTGGEEAAVQQDASVQEDTSVEEDTYAEETPVGGSYGEDDNGEVSQAEDSSESDSADDGTAPTEETSESETEEESESETETEEAGDPTADVETAAIWEATLPKDLTGVWGDDIVKIAQSQLGYTESTRNFVLVDGDDSSSDSRKKGYTRYGAWYGMPYEDWCAMFASFCLHYAGVPTSVMPEDSGTVGWVQSLRTYGLYAEKSSSYQPVSGDLVFFSMTDKNHQTVDHVGIVESTVTSLDENGDPYVTGIYTIEGNSANAVRENYYDISDVRILGYGVLPGQTGVDEETSEEWEETLPDLTGDVANDVVEIAESQVGYEESMRNFVLSDNWNKDGYTRYGDWYGSSYEEWNALFVSFCLSYAEDSLPTAETAAGLLDAMKEAGIYESAEDYTPSEGDVVFLASEEDDTDSENGGDEADRAAIIVKIDAEADEDEGDKESAEEEANVILEVIEGDCDDAVREQTYSTADDSVIGYGSLPDGSSLDELTGTEDDAESEDEEETGNYDLMVLSEIEEETETEDEYGIGLLNVIDNVAYIDENGATQTAEEATEVTGDDTAWSDGWYVVDSIISNSNRITVSGTVNLILADEGVLTADSGIRVNSGNTLNIYGQSGGTGELIATGVDNCAAIGSNNDSNSGSITINGGVVTANAGGWAAGIGGGIRGKAGEITINGGAVTATGGAQGAGIGNGASTTTGGTITINGGTVEAFGDTSYGSAGIGGGYNCNGGTITITGGKVNAEGGGSGAGIGGGPSGSGGEITISGGTVTASSTDGAGIGGGGGADGGTITIENCVIYASAVSGFDTLSPSGIIYVGKKDGLATVYGSPIFSSDVQIPEGMTALIEEGKTVTIAQGGTLTNEGELYQNWGSTFINNGTYTDNGTTYYELKHCYYNLISIPESVTFSDSFYAKGNTTVTISVLGGYDISNFDLTHKNGDPVILDADNSFVLSEPVKITAHPGVGDFSVSGGDLWTDYLYEDQVLTILSASPLTITMAEGVEKTTTDYIVANDGVAADLTLNGVYIDMSSNADTAAMDLQKAGACTITLEDGSENTLLSGQNHAGIEVPDGYEIIFDGNGILKATGGKNASGIGNGTGENEDRTNIITINNGTITANGGTNASGIGGGYHSDGGIITINDGAVTATGGSGGAGIGGGDGGDGGVITINDGAVTATGGSDSAGIGGGTGYDMGGDGGTITVYGGTITATGGADGAGIGGGYNGDGGTIMIEGGNVTAATIYGYAAGIGGGFRSAGGEITITDGNVVATGGIYAAGIGGGYPHLLLESFIDGNDSGNSYVTITGGTVWAYGGAEGPGIGCITYASNMTTVTISGGTVIAAEGGSSGGGGAHPTSAPKTFALDTSLYDEEAYGISGTFTMGTDGHAVIYASSIEDTSDSENWSGIISPESLDGEAVVYGSPIITTDENIPSDKTAHIAKEKNVTIADGSTLTNEGTVYQDWSSTFAKNGTYADSGYTYYEVASDVCDVNGYEVEVCLEGTTNYSDAYYAAENSAVSVSLPDGYYLSDLSVVEYDGSDVSFSDSDASFTMPFEPVKVTGLAGEDIAASLTTDGGESYTYFRTVQKAVDAAGEDAGIVTMLSDSVENVTIAEGQDITLDLAGYTLDGNEAGSVITNNGTLTLQDSGGSGIITNGSANNGGGVYNNGVFTMEGGTISDDMATSFGGGVYNDCISTFTMTGGTINGNEADLGGGVYNYYSSFEMSGGTISGNTAATCGGGVYNSDRCSFEMSGGTISDNTTSSLEGGGVYVERSSFTMTGGTISNNTASGKGGGVYSDSISTFTMTGGAVYANTANVAAADVYSDASQLTLLDADKMNSYAADNFTGWFYDEEDDRYSESNITEEYEVVSEDTTRLYLAAGVAAPVASLTTDNGDSYTNYGTVQKAVDAAGSTAGTVTMLADSVENVTIAKEQNITLDLNGHTLDGNKAGSVITNNGTLTLQDNSSEGAGVITNGSATYGGGVYNNINCTLNMESGTISGNTASRQGGGVYSNIDGVFNMESGTISDNTASRYGGGVYNGSGSFTMSDGTISGNAASEGGGVYTIGIFTMSGGTINGNTATGSGGGVSSFSADGFVTRFYMESGTITGNSASEGGGVYAGYDFAMTGGTISSNTADEDGGGVYFSEGTFTMGSGTISGNQANQGGGVYCDWSTFSMSGGAIYNNTADTAAADVNSNDSFITLLDANDMNAYAADNFTGWFYDEEDDRYSEGNITEEYEVVLEDTTELSLIAGVADPVASLTTDNGDSYTNYGTVQKAVDAAGTTAGTVTMLKDSVENVTIAEGQDITLNLAGYMLDGNEAGRVITNNGALVLTDSTATTDGDGNYVSGTIMGGSANYGAGINNNGTITMYGGTISNNKSTSYGGGVFNSSTFTMYGGMISDNESEDDGGGIYNTGGEVLIDGGTISNNKANSTSSNKSYGGGIDNMKGSVTLRSGTISGNESSYAGGGIHNQAELVISGGTISNNKSTLCGGGVSSMDKFTLEGGIINDNEAEYGGGIYNSSELVITSGTISNNTASLDGGGVYNDEGSLTMNGGTISGNTASSDGGGVCNYGTFTMIGGAVYSNTANKAAADVYSDASQLTLLEADEMIENVSDYIINGWFYDEEGNRYADAESPTKYDVVDGDTNELSLIAGYVLSLDYNLNDGNAKCEDLPAITYYRADQTAGSSATIAEVEPTLAGYVFAGWATEAEAEKAKYQPGEEITFTEDTVLYAVWNSYDLSLSVSSDIADNSKDYDGEPVTLTATPTIVPEFSDVTYTYQWCKDEEELDGETNSTLTLDGNVADSGFYTCKVKADVEGVEYDAEGEIEITITKAENSLTITEDLGKTYDGNAVTESPAISADFGANTVIYTWYALDESGEVTGDALDGAPVSAGTYRVVASIAGTDNYAGASNSVDFEISKAGLTVSANNKNIAYGEAAPTFTVTYAGFVNDESTDVLSGTLTYDCDYTAGSGVGSYTITPSGLTGDNYEITFVNGTLTVTQAQNSLTITEDLDKTYDGSAVTESPAISADFGASTVAYTWYAVDETGEVTGNALDGAPTNAGTYRVVASIAETANYAGSEASLDFEVSKAGLTVTANNETIKYSEAKPTFTVTYDSFVDDESEDVLDGTLEFTCKYTAGDGVGTYTITPSGLTSGNYEIAFVDGILTVTQAENSLTITTESLDKTYDGDAVEVPAVTADFGEDTVTYTWYAVDESGEVTGDALDGAPTNAGKYRVVAFIAETADYAGDEASLDFEISKAELTVTAEDQSIKYDESKPTFTVTYDGFVDGESEDVLDGTLEFICEYTVGSDVGSYPITPYGLTGGNYDITFVNGTLTVTQAENSLTITTESLDKTYDGTAVGTPDVTADFGSDTVTYTWYALDESGDITGDALDGAPAAAGTYRVVVSVAETDNYAGASDSLDVTISKATYDMSGVSFADASYTYDGTEYVLEITGTLPDGVQVSYTANALTDVGEIEVTASFTGDADNYELIESKTATLTILDATFVDGEVTGEGHDGTYDGQAHSIIISLIGDAEGAMITYSTSEDGEYTEDNPTYTDAGTYTVYYKVSKANYTDVTGSLTVNIARKAVTENMFTVDTTSEAYSGEAFTKEISAKDEDAGNDPMTEDTDYVVSYEDNTDAGTATITITGIGNYTGTLTYIFEIEKAAQDISYNVTAITKLETARAFINELSQAFISPEAGSGVTYSSSDVSIAMVDEATGEIILDGTGKVTITATAAATANYAEASASYELTVVEPEETVTADVEDHPYDGNEIHLYASIEHDPDGDADDLTYSYQWYRNDVLIEGETEEILTLRGEDVAAQEGTVYTCVITISDAYFTVTEEASFTVTILQADNSLTITTESLDKTYDGDAVEDPEVTADFGEDTVEFTWYEVDEDGEVIAELDQAPSVAGTYKVVASVPETNNYAGASVELTFTIVPQEITEDMFTVDTEDETYSGSEAMKEILSDLAEGTDYTVSYAGNTNAGTATITITGIGNYTGELKYTFEIKPQEITEDLFDVDIENETYNGSEITKNIKTELVEGEDYEVSYENNVNAGTAYITIVGIGNYTGELKSYSFTIDKAVYDMSGVSFADITYTYDGTEHVLEITGELPDGVEVSYSENALTDVGELEVTASFKGDEDNYELIEDRTAVLTIIEATFEDMDITATGYDGTYDGEGHSINVELSGNAEGAVITYSLEEDGEFIDENPAYTDAGTYTVYYKVSKDNYNDVIGSLTVEIRQKDLAEDMFKVDSSDETYTGEAFTKEIISDLTEGVDYEASYENNVNAGDGEKSAKIIIKGMGNYTGELTYTFTINPITVKEDEVNVEVTVPDEPFIYDGTEKTPEITVTLEDGTVLEEGKDYDVSYNDNVDAGKVDVTIEFIGNYTGESITETDSFEIKPADVADMPELSIKLSGDDFTYDGKAKTPTVTVTLGDGTKLTEGIDYTVTYKENVEAGTATVIVKFIGNYTGTETLTFTIKEAESEEESESEIETESETVKESESETETEDESGIESAVQTGDNTPIASMTLLLLAAGICFVLLTLQRREHDREM